MNGPFCYQCGQHERSSVRHAGLLLRDILHDVLNLDSRAIRTLKPLLFRPGFLTLEYFAGRRQRYVPPLRLYVIASVIFFLVVGLGISMTDGLQFDVSDEDAAELLKDPEVQEALKDPGVAKALGHAAPAVREALAKQVAEQPVADSPESTANDASSEPFVGVSVDEDEDGPIVRAKLPKLSFLPAFARQWLADTNRELEEKANLIGENPNKLIDVVLRVLPQSMFILLPLFALLLKLFYPFANRLYMEHLIVALHSHCFLFILLTLLIALNYGVRDASGLTVSWPALEGWLEFVTGVSLIVGVPVYLYLMQKRVYGQNHTMTAFKYFFIGLVYVSLLAIVIAIDIVVGILRM